MVLGDHMIETKHLSKYYGKHLGIDDVNLLTEKGEIFGFIGPNGSGKSTTIRLLLNLIYKTAGESYIFGLDTENKSKEIKRKIGYVPSEVNYYEFMKVRDLLQLTKRFYSFITNNDINELCEFFEIDQKRKIRELSYGNKKKLAIIQAVIRKPELLILDEPTNGLDPFMQLKLFELLEQLKNHGTTIFLSSHNLNEVQKYCDRVAIIKEGKIILVDHIDHIMNQTKRHVRVTTKDGEIKEFESDKNPNEILKDLSGMDLVDIEIRKSSLEDDFLGYYKGE